MEQKKNKKNRTPGRVIGRILLGLLGVFLIALFYLFIAPLTERDGGEVVSGSADWMAALSDALPLNEAALPGTHDSGTKYVQLAYFSKCQSKDIAAQLTAGFRYLDIRLGVSGDSLVLMHGFTYCKTGPWPWSPKLTLAEVLGDCYAFLSAHPGETVLFSVKQEHGTESIAEFERLLAAEIGKSSDHWLLTDTLPTLGEARGKLILLRRYEDEAGLGRAAGIPLLWAEQGSREDTAPDIASEQSGGFTLWVQDRYKYDTADKWRAFTNGLMIAGTDGGAVSLSFLSTNGNTAYGHPYGYAKKLNETFTGYDLPADCGWIILDFATAPLAAQIYGMNFR